MIALDVASVKSRPIDFSFWKRLGNAVDIGVKPLMICAPAKKGKSTSDPGPIEKSSIGWKGTGKGRPNMALEPSRR